MGTKTDLSTRIEHLVLSPQKANGVEIHGFFKTQEGRSFLRYLFPHFLRRARFGEGKVASIVADNFKNLSAQRREVDRTKSALRRWNKDRQAELWPKDARKNLRQISRIEIEMMAIPEISEILSDLAKTSQKTQSGVAFSNFFYRSNGEIPTDTDIRYLQERFSGVFRVMRARKLEAKPYNPETSGTWEGINLYYRLKPIPKRGFMLAQVFEEPIFDTFPNPDEITEQSMIRNLMSGYGFPLPDGSMHLLLSQHAPPFSKSYEVLMQNDDFLKENDLPKGVNYFGWFRYARPIIPMYGTDVTPDESTYWERIRSPEDSTNILKSLDKVIWNVKL